MLLAIVLTLLLSVQGRHHRADGGLDMRYAETEMKDTYERRKRW